MEEGEAKQPKKRNFSGMKKKPKLGRPKEPKKKYAPFTYKGKLKPNMTEYQKRTMNEFMKVREGETLEQWQKRTSRRRVKDFEEVEKLYELNPLRIMQRNRERNVIANKNKYIVVQPVEREFDFMRYYGIVINYYSIKYGIRKEDLEVGFYFYSNIPFSRQRFNNVMILHVGCSTMKLSRFIKDGMVEEVIRVRKRFKDTDVHERTNLFRLTKNFVHKLTEIYRTLGMMNTIQIKQPMFTPLCAEIKQIILDMNDEIMDIQTGRKPQDKLKKE